MNQYCGMSDHIMTVMLWPVFSFVEWKTRELEARQGSTLTSAAIPEKKEESRQSKADIKERGKETVKEDKGKSSKALKGTLAVLDETHDDESEVDTTEHEQRSVINVDQLENSWGY